MFMHGGWFHIIGNMWFLAVFGDNVEDALGSLRFILFYLLCGVAAAALQVVTDPGGVVPMVGASGAIGGVMGAYAVLFPRAPVHVLVFFGFFFTRFVVPAVLMLGYWFIVPLLGGIPALAGATGGIAFGPMWEGFSPALSCAKYCPTRSGSRPSGIEGAGRAAWCSATGQAEARGSNRRHGDRIRSERKE